MEVCPIAKTCHTGLLACTGIRSLTVCETLAFLKFQLSKNQFFQATPEEPVACPAPTRLYTSLWCGAIVGQSIPADWTDLCPINM